MSYRVRRPSFSTVFATSNCNVRSALRDGLLLLLLLLLVLVLSFYSCYTRRRDSIFGILTGLRDQKPRNRGSIVESGERFFFILKTSRPDPHRIPSCSVSYRGSFLGSKSTRGRDDNTPPVNAKIKNECSHASTTNVPL